MFSIWGRKVSPKGMARPTRARPALKLEALEDRTLLSGVQDLPYWEFQNLSVEQVSELTPAQIGSIPNTEWFLTLPAGSLPMLSHDQVQAINTATVDIFYLTGDQRAELTTEQVQQLPYWEFQYLSVAQVGELTPEQVGSIRDTEWLLTLPAGSLPKLSHDQVQAINTATVDIFYLTGDQRAELTTGQVQQLPYWEFQYLSVGQVVELTPEQVGWIQNTEWLLTLPAGSLPKLTRDQVQAINTATVDIFYLTGDQRAELTTEQVQQLPFWEFQYLSVPQVLELMPEQVASIPNRAWFETLSPEAQKALGGWRGGD
jgi:hypothetical protein